MPGEIRVVAYDKEGDVAAETSIVTAAEPAAIELVSDRPSVKADGDDIQKCLRYSGHTRMVDSFPSVPVGIINQNSISFNRKNTDEILQRQCELSPAVGFGHRYGDNPICFIVNIGDP